MSIVLDDMKSGDITVSVMNEVGTIEFKNHLNYNGLTLHNMPDVVSAILYLSEREDVKIIVLKGREKYFCSGGSVELLQQLQAANQHGRRSILELSQTVVRSIKESNAVVVAFVDGLVAGAGLDILLACDRVFVSERAKINFSYNRLNLVPDAGGLFFLKEKLGAQLALALYLEAPNLNSEQMLELDIAQKIIETEDVNNSLLASLKPMLKNTKHALSAAKQSLWRLQRSQYEEHMLNIVASVCTLIDTKEHISALARTEALQKTMATVGSRGS